MDGSAALVFACAVTGGCWLLLAASIPVTRRRAHRRSLTTARWTGGLGSAVDERGEPVVSIGGNRATARSVLENGLRDPERDVRVAAITTLAGLAPQHEWAVDGLVEALAMELETPGRVAAELDRLAPRPGRRLVPLLAHPSQVVRFYAVRLLARYPELARRHVPDLTRDVSPNVRAGALETLRAAGSAEALRCALALLEDPRPFVRAHAGRTVAAIAGASGATFVAPLLGDDSWWVRNAARESLVTMGQDVASVVTRLLEADDPALRSGAALVLQDVGILDGLLQSGDPTQAERILGAGGSRFRRATSERAHRRRQLRPQPEAALEHS